MSMTNEEILDVYVHHAYDPPPKVVMEDFGPSLARESELEGTDINKIVARFHKTGVLPVDGREAFFADVSGMPDYRTALEHVQASERYFMSLPAKVRERFSNSPAEFLDFCSDESNRAEMVEMGLIEDRSGEPPARRSSDVEPPDTPVSEVPDTPVSEVPAESA